MEAAEKAQFSRQQITTPRVVEAAVELHRAEKILQRLIGEDVELEVSIPRGLGRIRVDPTQLDQVLMNLSVNARDAMPGGGRLGIRAANVDVADIRRDGFAQPLEPGRYVHIQVTDTGTGMDAETQRRVFEPFFTTKAPGQGTGLGLSTVFGIVKQSGGFIRIDSEMGIGSTFEVFLPRTDEEPEPSTETPSGPAPVTRSATILVVEDDPAVRSVICRSLERDGHRVHQAADGGEGLATWQRQAHEIDLVLTDMIMPRMGGAELAARLRVDRPDLPIILMSGYSEDEVLQRSKLDAGIGRLEKPFTAAELRQMIRDVLGKAAPGAHPTP